MRGVVDRVRALSLGPRLRSIGVLVSGTAVAHAITALAMPISTRLYSPTDFAAASVFSSLVGILLVASCLRFELAIPLPDEDEEAVNLLALSAAAVVATSALAAGVLLALPSAALGALGQPDLIPHLWLLPLALLVGGLYLALQMWFVRRKGFGPIARSRVLQSGAAAGGQTGLGMAGFAPLGLLVGQMLNYGAGAVTLGAGLLIRERGLLSQVSLRGMAHAARAYQKFPRYSIWEALANSTAIHLPILLIAALAAGPEAGYLALAIFLLQAPMALLGTAVGQVYLSGAPEAQREGRLAPFTVDTLSGLIRVGSAPLVFLAIVSPSVFGLVFGEEWTRAGVLVTWMAPWFLLQFVASPISAALHVTGQQSLGMALQIGGLVLRTGAVIATAALGGHFITEVYAVTGLVFYAVCILVSLRAVGARLDSPLGAARQAVPWVALGVSAGIVTVLATSWLERLFGA